MKSNKKQTLEERVKRIYKQVLKEATFKTVKVTYSNGEFIETSVNPNVSDADIQRYFRIGSKVNLGGPNGSDRVVTIKNVEVLGTSEY